MRLRIRRSHIYLILILGLLSIGWTLFIRLDKFKTPPLIEGNDLSEKYKFKSNLSPTASAPILLGKIENDSFRCFGFKKIDCLINNEYSIGCYKTSDDMVYVPFNFIRRYFDIYGKLIKTVNKQEIFDWEHSYSKIYYPKEAYDHKSTYLWFDSYNVEVRDRVKLISGLKGVPISTQWEPRGHFYPIQIAQFGLSHFSKSLTLGKPRVTILEDGFFKQDYWHVAVKGSRIQIHSMEDNSEIDAETSYPTIGEMKRAFNDNNDNNNTININNKVLFVDGEAITFKLKRKKMHNDLTLSLRVKPLDKFSFTVYLQSDSGNYEYAISYANTNIDFDENGPTYGFGESKIWHHLTRELGVDFQKACIILDKKLPIKIKNLHVSKIIFKGKALIDDVILSSSAHESHFFSAVRWLLENQDDLGGWPIKTTRKLSNGALILKPGWYSAMAQGQAISLLTRMYHYAGDEIYLKAATRALSLFNVSSEQGGFRTYFLDKYLWFEEYPTIPSSFVLNGFIYSLFGLYDLKMSCAKQCETVEEYFKKGLESLNHLISLYDTGSGTLYDLRHFSLKTEPKIARWDYHTTHINQLLYLNTLLKDQYLSTVSKRWIGYLKGKRAAHN